MSYLTVDGTALNASDYGLIVAGDFPVPLMGEPRLNVQPLSQADGVAIQGSSIDALVLNVPVAIIGSTSADSETKVANLVNFFQTRMGRTYYLIWSERPTKRYTVTLRSAIDVRLALAGMIFNLSFQDTLGYPETV